MSSPEPSTTRPALDPVMVAGLEGDTWTVWQVETDPDVTLGDFSGAWIIDREGIQGFAASAEWIAERQDPEAMLRTVLRYPVIPIDEHTKEALAQLGGIEMVDFGEVERASGEMIEAAKQEFAAESPGKKQPAWGSIPALEIADGPEPAVLRYARGLRTWIRAWNAFDKLRIRRLARHEQPSGLPGVSAPG